MRSLVQCSHTHKAALCPILQPKKADLPRQPSSSVKCVTFKAPYTIFAKLAIIIFGLSYALHRTSKTIRKYSLTEMAGTGKQERPSFPRFSSPSANAHHRRRICTVTQADTWNSFFSKFPRVFNVEQHFFLNFKCFSLTFLYYLVSFQRHLFCNGWLNQCWSEWA